MKYITLELVGAMGLFDFFPYENHKKKYYEYIDTLIDDNSSHGNLSDPVGEFHSFYEYCVTRFLKEYAWKYSHICQIVFDDYGKVLPLDENVYEKLEALYSEHITIRTNAFEMRRKEAKKAARTSSCPIISHLSEIQYHDSTILSIDQTDSTLCLKLKSMEGLNDKTDHQFIFHLSPCNSKTDYAKYVNWIVIYEEVCIKSLGVYEYNILIYSNDINEYKEVSICFSSVKMNHIQNSTPPRFSS